jgi:hypothetical protein
MLLSDWPYGAAIALILLALTATRVLVCPPAGVGAPRWCSGDRAARSLLGVDRAQSRVLLSPIAVVLISSLTAADYTSFPPQG